MGYRQADNLLEHKVVPHKACLAIGNVHTNNIENFWSIVKRGITGIYQHISEKYLDGYMSEFAYKYNYRETNSTELFYSTLSRTV